MAPRMHDAAVQPATVELVMSPPGSDRNGTPEQTGQPTPDITPPPPPEPAPPPQPEPAVEPAQTPKPEIAQTPPPQPAVEPAPASEPKPLQFSLGGIESDTNALVRGDIVVPPRPDINYHNRKPSYPREAVLQNQQGAVLLVIHVSPEGLVSTVDIAQSSGFAALDKAARDAVETWHFTPAVRDGEPVPFDVSMRIVFSLY